MVEVKGNEEAGDGEGEGRPGNQKGDRQRERQTARSLTNLFTVTHCASERKGIAAPLKLNVN